MTARVTNNFRLFQAKSMVDGLKDTDQSDVFYLYTGHSAPIDSEFNDAGQPISDLIPPIPQIGYSDLVVNYDTMISMSRILIGGIGRVIRRYDWVANTLYRAYHTHGQLHSITETDISINGPQAGRPYYVVNADTSTGTPRLNVYKCLYTPYDTTEGEEGFILSTVAPTGTDINPFTTGDGYTWKFLYTIAPSESLVFNTSEWTFVSERISAADRINITTGSIKQRQLNVQDNTVKGEVYSVSVLNGGSGLIDGEYPVTLTNGVDMIPGQDFMGTAIVDDSELKVITTSTAGIGYVGLAAAVINPKDNGDVFSDSESTLPITHVNIADGNGHGDNIPAELNATTVMMNTRIIHEAGQNEFMIQNDFRQIGVIRNPIDTNTNLLAIRDHYRLTNYLDVASPISDVKNDDIIRNINNSVRARVVGLGSSSTLDSDNISRGFGTRVFYTLLDQTSNFDVGESVRGDDDGAAAITILSISAPEIVYDSGDIIYVENRKPINRATDQIESYNIVFGF